MVQEMETRDTRENSRAQVTPPDVTDTHTPDPKDKAENPNVAILRSAFPEIDISIIRAVLIASSNNVEKAFDGLLGMSDPTFKPDLPAQTPTHTLSDEQQIQILADEEFARQVALQGSRRSRQQNTGQHATQQEPSSPETTRNFIDDDLPVLKENIIQGFNETKSKVNSFLSSIRSQYAQKIESQASTGERGSQGLYHQNPRSSTQYDRDAHVMKLQFPTCPVQ